MKQDHDQGAGTETGTGADLALNINFVYLCACSCAHLVLLDNHTATKLPTISFITSIFTLRTCVCV